MNKYYSDLARYTLSVADQKIIATENYLLEADAPEHLRKKARRLLNSVRKLQDEINRMQTLSNEIDKAQS